MTAPPTGPDAAPAAPEAVAPPRRVGRDPGRVAKALAWARAEPATAALIVAGVVCVLLPLASGRYLPLLDYPNHLSMVFVWRHVKDPHWGFYPHYITHLMPLPYWAHYGAVYLLSYLVSVEAAQRIFLAIALLLFPLSLAVLARRLGRDPRLGLLAFPFAWSFNTANGFLAYVAGVPVMLLALAALHAWAERPTVGRGLLASALGSSLYFFHILPWGLFLIVGGFTALVAPRPWRPLRAVIAGLPTLPAAAVGLWAYRAARGAQTYVNPWSQRGLDAFEGAYNDYYTSIASLPAWLLNFHPGRRDEIALLAIFFFLALLAASRGPTPGVPFPEDVARSDERSARGWRVELALALTLTAYLMLPRSLMKPFYWYAVNGRVAVLIALFALLLPRGPLVGVRRLLLYLGAVAGLAYCVDVAGHVRQFNVGARGFDEVMAHARPRTRVLPIMLSLSDPAVNVNAYNQWGCYVQLRQGGYVQYTFPTDFPIRTIYRLPAPAWDHPEQFSFPLHGEAWDYFLVRRGPPPAGVPVVDPFAGYHERVRLVARSGAWELWEKLPAPAGTLPPSPPSG